MTSAKITYAHLRILLIDTLWERKGTIVRIALSLVLLAIAQSFFVLLTGPLFKSMFGAVNSPDVSLLSLAPQSFHSRLAFLEGISAPRELLIKLIPGTILFAGILMAIAGFSYQYNQQALTLYVGSRYREKLFRAVIKQPLNRLLVKAPGEWMSLIMNDVAYLQSRLSDLLVGLVKDTVTVFAALVTLAFVHWPTALVLCLFSIPLMFGTGKTGKKISRYSEEWQKNLAKMAAALLDMRKRFEFIRAQSGEASELARFKAMNDSYYKSIVKSIFIRSAFAPGLEFLGFAMLAFIIFLLSKGVFGEDIIKSDQLLQFLTYLGVIIRPLRSIGEQVSRLQETGGIIRRSVETFSDVEAYQTPDQAIVLSPIQSLEIQRLNLDYGGTFTLKAESLKVKAGERIAIIGPSGGGKSTLLKCIGGLYEPKVFEANLSWKTVKDNASLVSQKPFLFSGSIQDNLSYGLGTEPSEEAMHQALRSVNLLGELSAKGQSLTSELDFLQGSLSGGQMQRLTIARGLLRPHSIWLMDEVTSAIDPAAEEAVTKTILEQSRKEDRILLYVTHRFSQLESFDQLWFAEAGIVRVFHSPKEWQKDERVQAFIESETNH